MKTRITLLASAAGLLAASSLNAALSVTSAAYTYGQDFDTLATSGTSVAWANDSTLAGWSLFNKDLAAITTYRAENGSGNTGSFYSYGATGSYERSLGGLGSGGAYFGSPASGTVAGWIAIAFQNNSGSALSSFTVNYSGEQWRNGGNTSPQSMVLEYGFGSTFAGVTSWSAAGSSFDWTSPVTGATAGAVDGNVEGRVAGVGGTKSVAWNAGDTLWLRWVENNDMGNDHGLALDDLSFSVEGMVAVPEAGSWGLAAGVLLLGSFAWKQRTGRRQTTANHE